MNFEALFSTPSMSEISMTSHLYEFVTKQENYAAYVLIPGDGRCYPVGGVTPKNARSSGNASSNNLSNITYQVMTFFRVK